jgi:hypothetical protein
MSGKIRKTVAFATVILCLGAVTAFAANGPPLIGVTKGALNGVNKAAGANGALKANAVGNRQIKFGSVSCGKLSSDLKAALCTGKPGAPGTPGAPGASGSPGHNGGSGSNGSNGGTGSSGAPGVNAPGWVTTHATGGDSSVCGADWANDTYTRTLQFVPQDNGTIDVIRYYKGTFVTIAGVPQPNGSCPGTLQTGGVTGTFTGFDVVVVTGGNFDPDATCPANCTGDAMLAAFFPGATDTIDNGWEYHYDAGGTNTWTNASAVRGGNQGNIAG